MKPTNQSEKQDKKAYWRGIIEDWQASGKTKAAFCKERGLTANYLSTWHHRTWYAAKTILLMIHDANKLFYCPIRRNRLVKENDSESYYVKVVQLR